MHSLKFLTQRLAPWAFSGLLALSQAAGAQSVQEPVVGTVTNLAGVLVAQRADGAKLLAINSQVRQGDTLVTGANAWARMRFVDGAELILQPDSRLVLTRYVYDAANPQLDSVELGLERGTFRSTSGLIDERSKNATVVITPLGNITTAPK